MKPAERRVLLAIIAIVGLVCVVLIVAIWRNRDQGVGFLDFAWPIMLIAWAIALSVRIYRHDRPVPRRIRGGVELLDRHNTNWPASIDASKLDVNSYNNCPLSQLFKSYGRHLDRLDLSVDLSRLDVPRGVRLGFTPPALRGWSLVPEPLLEALRHPPAEGHGEWTMNWLDPIATAVVIVSASVWMIRRYVTPRLHLILAFATGVWAVTSAYKQHLISLVYMGGAVALGWLAGAGRTTPDRARAPRRIRGAVELLDDREPDDWALAIDVNRLNMQSCRSCVLGQLHGEYFRGLRFLQLSDDEPRSRGFIARRSTVAEWYLNRCWRNYLNRRKAIETLSVDEEGEG